MKALNPLKAILLALVVSVSCTQVSPIPKKTLQKIYYDMLLVDSKMNYVNHLRVMADTLQVYPAIFEKYGYTTEQFLAAQEYWLRKPEKLRQMFEDNKKIFDERLAVLQREMEVRDSIANVLYELREAEQAELENFLDSISFACLLDTIQVSFSADTFAVEVLERPVDTATSAAKPDNSVTEEPVETDEVDYVIEDDFGFKELQELQELEKASKKHQEVVKKRKEKENERKSRAGRKKELKEIEEKFK